VWNSAAQVADAYQIGRVESNAAINLHTKVNPEIIDRLAFLVKNLGHVDIKFFQKHKNNVNSEQCESSELGCSARQCNDVRKWSIGKMLTHESIASGAWNKDFSSGSASMAAWEEHLIASDRVLHLALDRMENNYDATHMKMRKPYGLKEVDPKIKT
jgi:hypothetical protein